MTELELLGIEVNVMLEKRVQGVMVDCYSANNPVQRVILAYMN